MYARLALLLAWHQTVEGGTGGGGAAPAAPVAPAAPAAPAVPATEAASQRAREALKAGGSLESIAAGAAPPAKPHHSQEQPRNEAGEFTKEQLAEQQRQRDEAAAAGKAVDGQPVAKEGEQPPAKEGEAAAGAEGAGGEAAPGTVLLQGLTEGEEPIELELDDPEAAQRIQALAERAQMLDSYVAREEDFTNQVAQLEEVRTQMEVDPGGYMLGMIPNNKPLVVSLTRFLLTQPAVWEALKADVASWDDPDKFRLASAEAKNERSEMRETLTTRVAEAKAVNANFAEIQKSIAGMIPKTMSKEQSNVFFADALRDLQYHANQNNMRTIPLRDVPVILAARLRANGIDPVTAAARAANGTREEKANGNGARQEGPPQKTGAEFVAGAKARTDLSRGGPTAGSPSVAIQPPPGMGISQTIEWHRSQVKAGRSVLGRTGG